MGTLVDVSEVTVNTVSVEIKTVMIGKKQMTLSVYRQLTGYDFTELGTRATLWGYVNTCDRWCENQGIHMHIIWSSPLGRLYKWTLHKEDNPEAWLAVVSLELDQLFIAV